MMGVTMNKKIAGQKQHGYTLPDYAASHCAGPTSADRFAALEKLQAGYNQQSGATMNKEAVEQKQRLDSIDLNALIDKELKAYGRSETGRMMAIEALLTADGINKLDADYEIFAHMDFGDLADRAKSLQVFGFYASDSKDEMVAQSIALNRTLAKAGMVVLNRILEVAGNVVDERIATRESE
jgi:hypothetical protein